MGIGIFEYNKKIGFDATKSEELTRLLLGKMPKKNVDKAIEKAVKPYGFKVSLDEEVQISDITLVKNKTGNEAVLLDALGGFLTNGSYYEIAMESDDEGQLICRWDYSSEEVKYSEWLVKKDSDQNEISRDLVTESNDDDHDPEWYCGDNMIKCRSHLLKLKQLISESPYDLDVGLVSTTEIAYLVVKQNKIKILEITSTNTDRKSVRNYYINGRLDGNETLDRVNTELEKTGDGLFESTDDPSIIIGKLEAVLNAQC